MSGETYFTQKLLAERQVASGLRRCIGGITLTLDGWFDPYVIRLKKSYECRNASSYHGHENCRTFDSVAYGDRYEIRCSCDCHGPADEAPPAGRGDGWLLGVDFVVVRGDEPSPEPRAIRYEVDRAEDLDDVLLDLPTVAVLYHGVRSVVVRAEFKSLADRVVKLVCRKNNADA